MKFNFRTFQPKCQVRWNAHFKDQGCTIVVPAQGFETSQGAVTEEYGAAVEK
jgi:hypothetical protein